MLTLPDYQITDLISDGAFTRIYRGYQRHTRAPVIIKMFQAEHPAPKDLAGLRHEYTLLNDLDLPGVAKPYDLLEHKHSLVLVQEDIGGRPLTDIIASGPCPLATFLPIAIALADILGQLHQRQIIHKDIKPQNIIVNLQTDQVQLIDFGLASRLSHEHPHLMPADQLEGTIAYMAPEQTGRMNRAVDYRTDFYSLGVTFYQLLTGQLPFQANDALEWVHCHIARVPRSLSELVPTIPPALSDIVLRLLAKVAEERYQSAHGLQYDLEQCRTRWEATGQVVPFALGTRDLSDRFQPPQKLYGRETEVATLLQAFDRVVASGQPEFVLVTGYAGIGKSALVHELHKPIIQAHGYFIDGKFDQYKRGIPYATVTEAFHTLTQHILSEREERIAAWRQQILDAVGNNGQLIVSVIPHVELIIGPQPPIPDLPPIEAQNRFQMVFQRFIAVFATPEHPLVLFLDDLQWADTASLTLIHALITDTDTRYLLMIGAYRDTEVDSAHPLLLTLDRIRNAGTPLQHLTLEPLARTHTDLLIADMLHSDRLDVEALAQLIFAKTRGNPFFCTQFVATLHREGLITFDRAQEAWTWDLPGIQVKGFTDNVATLLVGELRRLPATTIHALQLAGCLGHTFDLPTLALISERTPEATEAELWPALREGLILRRDATYTFLHDRVQEAAYTLIPPSQRAAMHLRIGRLLLARADSAAVEDAIFDLVNHLNQGVALLAGQEERDRVAELNLIAGKKAKAATAYVVASNYLAAGMALLATERWTARYDLTYGLYLQRAECEYLHGNFEFAEQLIAHLLEHARSNVDAAAAARVHMELLTIQGRYDQAIVAAIAGLDRFGIALVPHPTPEQVGAEYARVWQLLGDRPIKSVADLPPMTDPEARVALDLLAALQAPALYTDNKLFCVGACHAVQLSLQYGNADVSSNAYGTLAMAMAHVFGDYANAFQLGEVAYDLVAQHGVSSVSAKVGLTFAVCINPWKQHVRTSFDILQWTFQRGVEVGDVTFACYAGNNGVTLQLVAGVPLDAVERETERGLAFARKTKFKLGEALMVNHQRLIRHLRGCTRDFATFSDANFDEAAYEAFLAEHEASLTIAVCWYYIWKLIARFRAGEYEEALQAAAKAKTLLWTSPGFPEFAEYYYYTALAMAAHYPEAAPEQEATYRETLSAHQQQLQVWVSHCPDNFAHKQALLSAEIARIEGRELEAGRLYEQAIQAARANEFVQDEGLAYELAAQFYRSRSFEQFADTYLRKARSCYVRWGADGKVQQLDARYPQLRSRSSTATRSTSVEQLDTLAIVKALQAISGQIVLEQLLETLLRNVLESAGAQKGALLLAHGEDLEIAAAAHVEQQQVLVQFHQAHERVDMSLPVSLLNYVRRSREQVLLANAAALNPFSADAYLAQQCPKSVLCLPIMRQSALVGVLYLENNLVTHAFTPDRLAVLELLAAQAAISLENARLYDQLEEHNRTLEQKVAQRTAELEHTNALLREAKQIAEQANELKTKFLANMSHELRTPLNSILNFTRFLSKERYGSLNERQTDLQQRVLTNANHLLGLINDILDLSKIEAGHMELFREPTDLLPILQGVMATAVGLTKEKGLTLNLDVPETLPLVAIDKTRIRQVLLNLLSNAAKFTEHGGITLRAAVVDGAIELAVVDTGIGIAPEQHVLIFEEFRQVDSELARQYQATGLGLPISKRLVELHGGWMWLESAPGVGSTFAFTLPNA